VLFSFIVYLFFHTPVPVSLVPSCSAVFLPSFSGSCVRAHRFNVHYVTAKRLKEGRLSEWCLKTNAFLICVFHNECDSVTEDIFEFRFQHGQNVYR